MPTDRPTECRKWAKAHKPIEMLPGVVVEIITTRKGEALVRVQRFSVDDDGTLGQTEPEQPNGG